MTDIKSMFAKMANDSPITNGGGDSNDPPPKKAPPKKQTIEKTYQKKTQLEHILLRPDTYIGSVEKIKSDMWVYDEGKDTIVQRKIEYVPGLYKIFDEILVNAADNKQRDKKMDCIKIDINQEGNTISIRNNGKGIPVEMHKEEKMYVPTMIFGHLLTSSNYNDEEEKVTGGRNGYGAKLCNIFSTKFTVETASKEYKRQYKQTWGNNMTKASEPKVKDFSGEDFTQVTFSPDLSKFKMDKLDDDIVALMARRAYDVAASTRGVKVFLNGRRLPVKNFKDYVELYAKGKEDDREDIKIIYDNTNERWEVAFMLSPDEEFQQMSFVNSIATTKGGTHVDYIAGMVVKHVGEILKKKNKGGVAIKPQQIKNNMWIFINCLIVNPTFNSQTKEFMTLPSKNFGSKCTLPDKFFNGVAKSGLVEAVLSWAKSKEQKELAKLGGKKKTKLKGIAKLEDANKAGTPDALRCTLILTEGDSAKTLAVAGLGVVGRDFYGVFPLRGKLLNVREATHKQIMENAEINNLIKIINLETKKKYNTDSDMKNLRYGKIMIMTDQDQDGSHIKGLLINFIHYNWPELLRRDFLEEFITPIVKAKKKNEELSFYSLPEFEEWKSDTANHHTYQIKYYKGLGTSTSKEAKEYFSNMERHRIRFKYSGQQDDDHIVLAFSKKHVDHRKEWLTNFMVESKRRKELGMPDKYLYTKNTKAVSYTDFVNLELVLFSNADNIRSIPCLVDGLKPGQRKVMFTCLKRNDKREVKVAQLSGSVAEMSAYHHGEVSLAMTIVNLAQNFVGSNNINLLQPIGQFGTRMQGGKDSASPRYIFTKMSPLTRMLFHQNDDALLKHEYDDNQKIEPVWYIPIIPMILVNGADGIGTGWMTKIPNFNPRDLVKNIRLMMEDKDPEPVHPWYKNFKGTIEDGGDQRYVVSGEISIVGNNKIEITELPVGTWTQNYKENILEPLLHGSEKVKAIISDYKEYNTDTTVKFVISFLAGEMENCERDGFHKVFKLQTMLGTGSMCVFDELGCIKKFDSALEILNEYYTLRLTFYQKRKDYLEGMLEAEANRLSHQARFIVEKCDRTLVVENKKRKAIVEELIKRGYPPDPVKTWKARSKTDEEEEEAPPEEEEQEIKEEKPGSSKKPVDPEKAFKNSSDVQKFDYLLGMSMWMLTEEKKNELLRQRDNKLHELDILKKKSKTDLWREDLDVFMEKLDEVEEKERKDEIGQPVKKEKGGKRRVVQETLPSPVAQRIAPTITEDIKKKIQAAVKVKKRAIKKEFIADEDEKDEFDNLVKSKKTLKDKLGTPEEAEKKGRKKGTDGLKQTKLNFKKKSPPEAKANGSPKKRGKKSFSEDEDTNSDSSDVEFGSVKSPAVKERVLSKRAATKKIVYDDSEEDERFSSGEEELFDNDAIKEEPVAQQKMASSDSEEEKPPPPRHETSDDMFDSLLRSTQNEKNDSSESAKRKKTDLDSDSDMFSAEAEEKKSKPKKKKVESDEGKKTKGRKKKESDDEDFGVGKKKGKGKKDSDDEDFEVGKKKTKGKKKVQSDSDEEMSDSPPPVVKSGRAGGRAKQKTYVFSSDDSD